MLTITLSGGLGNQLFQYAFGRSLMHKYDVRFLLNCAFWGYGLNAYNTKAQIVNESYGKCIDMRNVPYTSEYTDIEDNTTVLCGWFQSEKYFTNVENELRKELTLKQKLSEEASGWLSKMRDLDSVSVVVRRGDYVPMGVDLPAEYYLKASQGFSAHKFFVFTDDAPWVLEKLRLSAPFEVVPHTVSEGLYLQSQCRHSIVSNSTYAWWGAWLNPRKDRTVIVPDPWFREQSHLWRDIVPERWTKLSY